MVLEVVHVVIHLHETLVADGERAGRCVLHTSVEHHVDDCVLYHFGIYVEVGHVLVLTECAEDGVGSRAHTALQRQEGLRDDAAMHVVDEEFSHEMSDFVGDGVAVFESSCLVGQVAFYDAHNLLARNFHVRLTDAVADVLDRNSLAIRRVSRLVNVLYELGVRIMETVEFEDDALCQSCSRRADAAGSGEIGFAGCFAFFDVAHFKDSPVDFAEESIAHLLCHVAEVDVVVRNFAGIHTLTEVAVRRVGCAILDSVCECEHSVGALTCRCSCEDAHLEGSSCSMLSLCNLCQLSCHCFRRSCGSESTECQILIVFNHCCSFGSR